eukprot:9298800-Pyramimonas_sp.AAC.1
MACLDCLAQESLAGMGGGEGKGGGRSLKKPRLVWTTELHQRFLNAVNHLGVKMLNGSATYQFTCAQLNAIGVPRRFTQIAVSHRQRRGCLYSSSDSIV